MNGTFFHVETVETPVRCVKIRFEESFASSNSRAGEDPLLTFEEFVNRHLAKGYLHFNLDMGNIPFPPTRLIALLIAITVRVRRRQGDVKLLNVASTARNNFSTFSALNFLTVEAETAPARETLFMTPPQSAPKPVARPQVVNAQSDAISEIKKTTPVSATSKKSGDTFSPLAENPVIVIPALPPNPVFDDDAAELTDIVEPPLVEQIAQKIDASPATATEKKFQLRVESRAANLYQLCDFVTTHAFAAGLHEKEIAKIKIAVYEACLNVIEHAYHSRPDEWIDLSVRYSPERLMIVIKDNGLSFEMKPPKDYDVNEVIDERRSGGFGLHIIRRAMDSVEYLPDVVNGNRLVMIKRLN